jgi:Holliday junction resolvasome RuvABC ATP-dependent DNA helicase subunit
MLAGLITNPTAATCCSRRVAPLPGSAESLYAAMEDFQLEVPSVRDRMRRHYHGTASLFTLLGQTRRAAHRTFAHAFGIPFAGFYDPLDLTEIVIAIGRRLGISLALDGRLK